MPLPPHSRRTCTPYSRRRYITRIRLPKLLVSAAIALLRVAIQRRGSFDLHDVAPIKAAGSTFVPALFAHADGDDFITPQHSRTLHAAYAGDSNFISFEGDHNSQVNPRLLPVAHGGIVTLCSGRSSFTRLLEYSFTPLYHPSLFSPSNSPQTATSIIVSPLPPCRLQRTPLASISPAPHWRAHHRMRETPMRGER